MYIPAAYYYLYRCVGLLRSFFISFLCWSIQRHVLGKHGSFGIVVVIINITISSL